LSEVICNTSPIQYLHQLGLLDLLPYLFGRITVPRSVLGELAEGQRVGVALPDMEHLDWADICEASATSVLPLVRDLGPGEREVLALALERPGCWVILDDRLARQVAFRLRIPLLGTLSVLLRAKRAGHLDAVAPILGRLDALGFRLDAQTQTTVLALAGEDA